MLIPSEFDAIRPYSPEELPAVYSELLAIPAFRDLVAALFKGVPFETIAAQLQQCQTNQAFQVTFMYPLLEELIATQTDGTDMDATALDTTQNYTFVSNHRDIVIDSAFLSVMLLKNGFARTVEIAIGDNLLVYDWIRKLVRVNKSFIVERSLGLRQQLAGSLRLSRYIHFAIREKEENVWIAQREGRAKNADDRTQEALLKMLAMGGDTRDAAESLRTLHIAPLAISYEYDPCDYLKAQKFQQKRDNADFRKTKADDLLNMQTGIYGYKGRVHYQAAACLDHWLCTQLDKALPKAELFTAIAKQIDREIHRNYRLYAGNYVAADLLSDSCQFAGHYSEEEKKRFEAYLQSRLALVTLPVPDVPFLQERLLEMYANPVFNYVRATR